jgi:Transglutaminase-like superfamily
MQYSTPNEQTTNLAAEPRAEYANPPAYFFSADAYCCELGDGAIILDLRNDTYVGIDRQHVSYLKTRIGNWPDSTRTDRVAARPEILASASLISDLLSRGILTTTPTPKQPTPGAKATKALSGWNSGPTHRRIPPTHIVQFVFSVLMVTMRLRKNGLASLLRWIRVQQSSIDEKPVKQENSTACVASFIWLRVWWYTAYRRCLFDSLVLSVYLTRQSIPCTFAIGVATKPFLAHAWVQIGDCVLNDTAEHVQEFEPILSIGH